MRLNMAKSTKSFYVCSFSYYWHSRCWRYLAEPAIGAPQAFGSSVDVVKAPYLYEFNNWALPLVLMVGAERIAAILGTVRFVQAGYRNR